MFTIALVALLAVVEVVVAAQGVEHAVVVLSRLVVTAPVVAVVAEIRVFVATTSPLVITPIVVVIPPAAPMSPIIVTSPSMVPPSPIVATSSASAAPTSSALVVLWRVVELAAVVGEVLAGGSELAGWLVASSSVH